MENISNINQTTKKRTYIDSFGFSPMDTKLFKPKFKESNNINLFCLIEKTKDLTINNNIKEQYSLDLFYTNLFAKIFASFDYSYQKYLEAKKNKQNNKNKRNIDNKKNKSNNQDNKKEKDEEKTNKNNNDKSNNNNDNPNNNICDTNKNNLYTTYINEIFYPLVKNFKNINPKNVNIIEIEGDGNCLFRSISQFLYGNQYMHKNIRMRIYNEALSRLNVIPNVIIETERGNYRIHEYIHTIKEDGNYGGDLELSIAYDIFNINIAQYLLEKDENNNIINLKFIKYINDDNSERKNLLLLINENRDHFMVGYYNNTKLDLNFNPSIINGNEKKILNETKNINISDLNNNSIFTDSQNNNKFIVKDLSKLSLEEIIDYYNDNQTTGDNLGDIYYYIYHFNKSNNKEGKYSDNFLKGINNSNDVRKKKKLFKKRIKNYNIGSDKRLKKFVEVYDNLTDTKKICNLTVIRKTEINDIMRYYHKITGHKNYRILHEKILSEGYYFNNITLLCKDFIKNCELCVMKNKGNFIPPPSNQIICSKPRELYLIDITELPKQFNNINNNRIYLLTIIDHFSKYAGTYLINNKESNTVLNKIKDFIKKNGQPEKILTDNGSEFINNKFKKFCKKLSIILLHGRARHPQTQGAIERYNRTIKDYLKNIYFENDKNGLIFDLNKEIENSLDIYNKTKHSTTGFSPKYVFDSCNESLFEKIKKNTIKSQKYSNKNKEKIIENKKGLLAERFTLIGNKIKKPIFNGKGRYSIPILIVKNNSNSDYYIKNFFNINNLEKDKYYYADYSLLKLCEDNLWNELYDNFHKKNDD